MMLSLKKKLINSFRSLSTAKVVPNFINGVFKPSNASVSSAIPLYNPATQNLECYVPQTTIGNFESSLANKIHCGLSLI